MNIKFKKLHPDAVIPSKGTEFSAGLDITAISKEYGKGYISYGTGLAMSIPKGYMGLIFPRSSISNKNLTLSNSVGIIDSDYVGEISFRFKVIGSEGEGSYEIGDRIGQLVIVPFYKVEFEEVTELPKTDRGSGGYGSTDKKTLEKSQAW